MNNLETIIFKNKSLSDILSNIYDNSVNTSKEIKDLIDTLIPMINTPSEAVMLVPLIANYMGTKVKNDENLIKMANIIQKHISSNVKGDGSDLILSETEMENLYLIAQDMKQINLPQQIPLNSPNEN